MAQGAAARRRAPDRNRPLARRRVAVHGLRRLVSRLQERRGRRLRAPAEEAGRRLLRGARTSDSRDDRDGHLHSQARQRGSRGIGGSRGPHPAEAGDRRREPDRRAGRGLRPLSAPRGPTRSVRPQRDALRDRRRHHGARQIAGTRPSRRHKGRDVPRLPGPGHSAALGLSLHRRLRPAGAGVGQTGLAARAFRRARARAAGHRQEAAHGRDAGRSRGMAARAEVGRHRLRRPTRVDAVLRATGHGVQAVRPGRPEHPAERSPARRPSVSLRTAESGRKPSTGGSPGSTAGSGARSTAPRRRESRRSCRGATDR